MRCKHRAGHIRFLIGRIQICEVPKWLELKTHTTPETPKRGYEQELAHLGCSERSNPGEQIVALSAGFPTPEQHPRQRLPDAYVSDRDSPGTRPHRKGPPRKGRVVNPFVACSQVRSGLRYLGSDFCGYRLALGSAHPSRKPPSISATGTSAPEKA